MRQICVLWCLLSLPLCSAHSLAAEPPAPHTRTGALDAVAALATAGGTTLSGPGGWSVRRTGPLLILDAPEPDTHMALADVHGADAQAAAKAAWALYRPGLDRQVTLVTERAARNGWDERKALDYKIAPNERAEVQTIASRSGAAWTVLIIDATEHTWETRAAAFGLVLQSVRPKGYVPESFAGRTPNRLDPARIAAVRAFLVEAMKQARVEGASFALLEKGAVVYEGGIGVREQGKSAAVDADTVFMAGGNTKGMSSLLLATLVDQGKLRWGQPVIEVYPAFRLGDAQATSKVLVKDLVCDCAGPPGIDLERAFEFKAASPQTSMALRQNNHDLMASAAGYIGGQLAKPGLELGAAYDQAMQERIFGPLGMRSTTFDMARALRADHASPHGSDVDGRTVLATMSMNYSAVPRRPTSGAWTSAHDLIRYVKLEADGGKLADGGQLVSTENLLARRLPQVALGENRTYGMGLIAETVTGAPVLYHAGSMYGYKSNLFLLPEAGVGAVLLTNSDAGRYLLRPFLRRLLEVLYDGKAEAADDVRIAVATAQSETAERRARTAVPAHAGVAGMLAKAYRSVELGDLAVRHEGRALIFDVGEWQSAVGSRKNADGSISFVTTDATRSGFEFVAGERQGKRVLTIRHGQREYVFFERG
jgi:CubicO group peptidase (beta-lactamase class C family)